MKDFIIWDKIHNKFLNIDFIQGIAFDNGKLHYIATNIKPKGLHSDLFNEEVEFLYDIGLKDINGKSIYADSSIVEFEYDNMNGYYNKVKGFIYKENWQYRLKVLWSEIPMGVDNLPMAYQITLNIKIIDTIQENKLGLIK